MNLAGILLFQLSNVRLGFCLSNAVLLDVGDPHLFQGEMVSWLYFRIRRSKAGGMHISNFKELKTGKELKNSEGIIAHGR